MGFYFGTTGGAANSDLSVTSKTTTYTATTADDVILCSGSAFTVTLYTAVGNTGKTLIIKKTDSSFSNIITIDGDGSETIDGSTTTTLNTEDEAIYIVSDGSNWQIIERRIPSIETSYTPTFTAFGTVTSINVTWKRIGDSIYIQGKFTSGTTTASEARVSLPSGLSSTSTISLRLAGLFISNNVDGGSNISTYFSLITASQAYLTFGFRNSGFAPLNNQNGNSFPSSAEHSLTAVVPINGWNG